MTNSSVNSDHKSRVLKILPGFNCGICGYARCDEFGHSLLKREPNLRNADFYTRKYLMKTGVNSKKYLEKKI